MKNGQTFHAYSPKMHKTPFTRTSTEHQRSSVKYHRINSSSSLPLVVPQPAPGNRTVRKVKDCVLIQSRQWMRFVILLGDPLVTCLALFGGLLLIGGTMLTSLAHLPMKTPLERVALTDSLGTARVIGPVLIGLGVLFLSSSVFNHQILLKRDRQRRKHKRQHVRDEVPENAACPPSISRSRKLRSADKGQNGGGRPPLPPSCPSVHQAAVASVVSQPPPSADGDAPPPVRVTESPATGARPREAKLTMSNRRLTREPSS
ncbi:uncharacterized protein LOC122375529 [Amphibalanus amphitrite]|uniref:uncharacterized protein LOC122375529 n=1 Tax=Amphibalanus amphitrite TaxID=1232801 RepID=UPI001C9011EA|nr:uncharacterized protein LOC122375529 [Amphibalanus amphitrite]